MARLLIIEDDVEIRTLVARFLQRTGFLVTEAADGDAGLKAFTEAPFDLVLTDGLLPKKSGYEVARAMRAMPKGVDVGIIMMTAAFRGPKAKKDALDEGVDAFFSKPFVLSDLKEKLFELLQKQNKPIPKPASTPPTPAAPAATTKPAAPGTPTTTPKPPTSSPNAAPVGPVGAKRAEPLGLPKEGRVEAAIDVARALRACARHRLNGVVELSDGASQLSIAFLRGVVVGASDNLRESMLGERLYKQGKLTTEQMRTLNARLASSKERVAEALLALGFATPDEALGFVEEQARARVQRALLWTGALRVVEDEKRAQKMATVTLDVIDAILAFGLDEAQVAEADGFAKKTAVKRMQKAPDFDSLLLAFARTKPDASLPVALLAHAELPVADAVSSSSSREVYAAWLAGLVRFADDPAHDPRPLPDVMRTEIGVSAVDRALVDKICATLLRVRGRSYYQMLNVAPATPDDEIRARIAALQDEVGPMACAGKELGPASSAARELWSILDDVERTFADRSARDMYDVILTPPPIAKASPFDGLPLNTAETKPFSAVPRLDDPSTTVALRANEKNEDAFLEGQDALSRGDLTKALSCFELAAAAKPRDPEYQSYYGWVQVLSGDSAGLVRLTTTMRENPQAMRPLFFLGLVAAKDGDAGKARAFLAEAARRAPLDVEVAATLRSLS